MFIFNFNFTIICLSKIISRVFLFVRVFDMCGCGRCLERRLNKSQARSTSTKLKHVCCAWFVISGEYIYIQLMYVATTISANSYGESMRCENVISASLSYIRSVVVVHSVIAPAIKRVAEHPVLLGSVQRTTKWANRVPTTIVVATSQLNLVWLIIGWL